MSEEPVSLTLDGLHAASEHARSWEQAVAQGERGETGAVLAHGRHVADVVPSGEDVRALGGDRAAARDHRRLVG